MIHNLEPKDDIEVTNSWQDQEEIIPVQEMLKNESKFSDTETTIELHLKPLKFPKTDGKITAIFVAQYYEKLRKDKELKRIKQCHIKKD